MSRWKLELPGKCVPKLELGNKKNRAQSFRLFSFAMTFSAISMLGMLGRLFKLF